MVCERGSRDNYGLLNWTVAEATPDLVYYQSYTYEVGQWDNVSWIVQLADRVAPVLAYTSLDLSHPTRLDEKPTCLMN